jgi:integrase
MDLHNSSKNRPAPRHGAPVAEKRWSIVWELPIDFMHILLLRQRILGPSARLVLGDFISFVRQEWRIGIGGFVCLPRLCVGLDHRIKHPKNNRSNKRSCYEPGHQVNPPKTVAGFGNWFRDQCDQANLHHCSAHGLRKATAAALAEAGATAHEIAAVTGHMSLEEVERYTRAARKQKLAGAAIAKLK